MARIPAGGLLDRIFAAVRNSQAAISSPSNALDQTTPHASQAAAVPALSSVFLGDFRVLTRTHQGIRMILDTRDIILTPLLLLEGQWEPETTRLLVDILKPGMNFVDVGANVGYFACLAGRFIRPGGKLWAFEADPVSFNYLTDNINLNWYFDDVRLVQKAVYERSGNLILYQRQKYKGNTSLAETLQADLDAIRDVSIPIDVTAVSLDDYFKDDDTRIDLVKIDVEGAEPFVLRGMQSLLERQPDLRLLFEWSPGQIQSLGEVPAELIAKLLGLGFQLELVGTTLQPVSAEALANIGHGMVLATRRRSIA